MNFLILLVWKKENISFCGLNLEKSMWKTLCLWWPRKTTKNKTQQYSIMLFVKPNRKTLCSFANPNRKTLQNPTEKHYAFWKSTEFIRCLCRWHDRKNEQQVWHIFVCRFFVGLQITVCCIVCKNKNVFFVLIQKQKCLIQQQKCILCFDTTTKMYIQQLMAQSKQQLTSNNILFFEIQTTYKHMMCVSTPINVFWGLLRIF